MKSLAFFLLFAAAALAQTGSPTFEVASIKPNQTGAGMVGIQRPDAGHFNTTNTPLRMLVAFAYNLRDSQISGGPSWLGTDRWDITAKTDREVPRTPEGQLIIRAMLQGLLADRFGLVTHKETKEMPVYALVAAKGGPKLSAAPPDAQPMMRMGMGTLTATKMPLSQLARALSDQLGRTVVDETGLTGDFNFDLTFAPEAGGTLGRMIPPGGHGDGPAPSDAPALTTAIQETLGLKLESRKAPVEFIVVDKAEKASEN